MEGTAKVGGYIIEITAVTRAVVSKNIDNKLHQFRIGGVIADAEFTRPRKASTTSRHRQSRWALRRGR